MNTIIVKASPYDPLKDKFSIVPVGLDTTDYHLITSVSTEGEFSITTTNPDLLTLDDWNRVINFPAYQLDLSVRMLVLFFVYPNLFHFSITQREQPGVCPLYVDGGYPKTFTVQVIDRYNRQSNLISRALNVRKCEILVYIFIISLLILFVQLPWFTRIRSQ
jgi:hypothetical protein